MGRGLTMTISNKALDSHINELPKEMSPERDLWQGIEKAIAHQDRQTNAVKAKAPIAWAASLVAAVLLTWYGAGIDLSKGTDSNAESFNVVALMQDNFRQQRALVLTSFGQPSTEELSPAMQEQLKQLESARISIEKALLEDDSNTDLLNLLRWTQQQELELLEKLFSPQWQTI